MRSISYVKMDNFKVMLKKKIMNVHIYKSKNTQTRKHKYIYCFKTSFVAKCVIITMRQIVFIHF